jgi:hypothetical protein
VPQPKSASLHCCLCSSNIFIIVDPSLAQQSGRSDEGAYVLALDNSWNRALETKDTKGLDLLLANTFVSVDIDGSHAVEN